MAFAGHPMSARFNDTTIRDLVRVGIDWARRQHGLEVSKEDEARITGDLFARYDGVAADDITRRSVADEMMRALNGLLDAKHMEDIGAIPIAEGKLHPIEDEV